MAKYFMIGRSGVRLQSLIGNKRQPEDREQTSKRAEQLVNMIIKRNENCAIVTHGFFMYTLIKVMKKQGFKVDSEHVSYKNGEKIILTRE